MTLRSRKAAAFLTAAVLLSAGTLQVMPELPDTLAATDSILPFAQKLLSQPPKENEPFAELRISSEQSQIYRDGAAVGDDFAGFCIRGGEPMVSRVLTETAAERSAPRKGSSADRYVTLEEAAQKIGCEIREENGETIVASPFSSGVLLVQAERDFDARGAVSVNDGYRSLHILRYETAADAYAAYLALSEDPAVISVEPNRTVCAAEESTDNGFIQVSDRWGIDAIGADPYRTWLLSEKETLPEIKVAVIDTGIYADHDWFRGRIAEGGTGFTSEERGSNEDGHSHGTHCAGIICMSTTDNVKILPLKSLANSGYGSLSEIYCAMEYALEQKADVVSMSLGGLGYSPLMSQAVDDLAAAGIPCVIAAGNESMDTIYSHPANTPSAFTVSAVGKVETEDPDAEVQYELADFSNFGGGIDFAAPGVSIESADIYGPDSTEFKSGTSMATPFVAACVADLLSFDKDMSNDAVYDYLKRGANDLGETGFDEQFGWGMVDLTDLRPSDNNIAMPLPDHKSGTYDGEQRISISADAGSTVYYTLDGTEPSAENGMKYTGTPILLTESCVLKAVAVQDGEYSVVVTRSYTITCSAPLISVESGAFSKAISVELSTSTPGAVIYYTTDGTAPSAENGTRYENKAITIGSSTALQAITVVGKTVSAVSREDYLIGGKDIDNAFTIENGVLTAYRGVSTMPDFSALDFTAVGAGAFRGCRRLMTVLLPDTVTTIGMEAFADCDKLYEISALGVTKLGDAAFKNCVSLVTVRFNGITAIPDHAFDGCTKLQNLRGIEKVVTIGEAAFRGCAWLGGTDFDWQKMQRIGAYAFANAWYSDHMQMDSLKTIGAYAFSNTDGINDVALPETITALPEGLFYRCGATLERLSLPGVTEIGDYAMAFSIPGTSFTLELPCEQITKVGAHAFDGFTFPDAPEFTHLTQIGAYAFNGSAAETFSFPALEEISCDALSGISAKVVYLNNVKTLADMSLKTGAVYDNAMTAVFSDSVEEISSRAFSASNGRLQVAAPAGSQIESYAHEHDVPFVALPAIVLDCYKTPSQNVYNFYTQQHLLNKIAAYPLTEGLAVQWFRCKDAKKTGAEKYSEGTELLVDTASAGEFYYYAAAVQDGEIVCESDVLVVYITPVKTMQTLTEDDVYTIINMEDISDGAINGDMLSAAYPLKVGKDGYYQVFSAMYQQSELSVIAPDGSVYAAYDVIEMHAGETYSVVLRYFDPLSCPLDVLYIHDYSNEFNGMYSTDISLSQTEFLYSGTPVEPKVTVTDLRYVYDETSGKTEEKEVVLTEGEDYILRYVRNDKPGTGTAYAIGTGGYCGAVTAAFKIYADIKEDQITGISLLQRGNAAFYRFTAPSDGLYRFYTQYPEQLIDDYCSGKNNYLNCDTVIDLYDASWNAVGYNDDADATMLSMLECSLIKGETYYIGVTCFAAGMSADVGVTRKTHVSALSVELADMQMFYTGAPLTPKIRVYDGESLLEEGKDYTLRYANNIAPGNITMIVTGIGSYCGTTINSNCRVELDMFSDALLQYIQPDVPFEVSAETMLCSLYLSQSGVYRLHTDDTQFNCKLIQYYGEWDEWQVIGQLNNDSAELELNDGSYYFLIQQSSAETAEYVLETLDAKKSVLTAEISAPDVQYTGEKVSPEITVTVSGEKLTENVDYIVSFNDTPISCGMHYFTVTGIGEYGGETTGTFNIYPGEVSVTGTLTEGTTTAQITSAGMTVFYSFVPERDTVCIYSNDMPFKSIAVFDQSQQVDFMNGIGEVYNVMYLKPGKTYLVAVSYNDVTMTGDISFRVMYDFRLFGDCAVEFDDLVMQKAGGSPLEYTLTYEGEALTEGVDYEVLSSGDDTQIGVAEILLGGIGQYVGQLTVNYYIYPETIPASDPVIMYAEESYSESRNFPGDLHTYQFTAPADGTYYFTLPNRNVDMTSFVYNSKNEVAPVGQRRFELKKGETLDILCVTDWLSGSCDVTDVYTISVTTTPPSGYYYEEGISYQIDDGIATVVWVDENFVGIKIMDQVTDEYTDVTGSFGGFSDEVLEILSSGHTVYGDGLGLVYEYCRSLGICYAAMEPDSVYAGDVTGDGLVYIDDALTLLRWLGEGKGMYMSEQAYTNADFNGDGAVDIRDFRAMLKYVADISVG